MARWRSRVAAAISLVLLAATLWLMVRSYQMAAHASWAQTVFSQPTPADREYARQQGYTASSIVSGKLRALSISRGALVYEHWNHRDVISFWDEAASRRVARVFDGWKWSQSPPPVPASATRQKRWRLGFDYHVQRDGTPTGNPFYTITVPLWPLAVALAIAPVVHTFRWLRGRRRWGAGLCPRCGYDLRATPDRCPECGHSLRA